MKGECAVRRLIYAVIVAAAGGFALFLIGQLLPRSLYDPQKFPYRAFRWEKGGCIYEKLGVHKWKDHVPDMSRMIPGMVKKKAALARTPESMMILIKETCGAELIHWLLIIFISPLVGQALGGWLGTVAGGAYALGNLAFIIIQRYNRPRLMEIYRRMEMRRKK